MCRTRSPSTSQYIWFRISGGSFCRKRQSYCGDVRWLLRLSIVHPASFGTELMLNARFLFGGSWIGGSLSVGILPYSRYSCDRNCGMNPLSDFLTWLYMFWADAFKAEASTCWKVLGVVIPNLVRGCIWSAMCLAGYIDSNSTNVICMESYAWVVWCS